MTWLASKRDCGRTQVGLCGDRVAEHGSMLHLWVLAMSAAATMWWFMLPDEHLALAVHPSVQLELLHGGLLLRLLEVHPLQGLC